MKILVILVFSFSISISYSQLKGTVFGTNQKKKETLIGATVRLLNGKTGTFSDAEGRFELILPKELPDTLVIQLNGYHNDTLVVTKEDRFKSIDFLLFSDDVLEEVVIAYRKENHGIGKLKILEVEEIGSGELRKAACCNLSESFETNASVDVNMTDAVSGAKKIQLLGLDGVYSQIQLENIPYLRGLESSYGLNSIPGTWVESIQITKGTGNVVNGNESMAGLINLELKKPTNMEKLFLNFYTNIFGREELNLNSGKKLNEKWSTGWFAHVSTMLGEMDGNKDGFRDLPKGTNYAFLNRWQYYGKKFESQFGFNVYSDTKLGGQIGFDRKVNDGKYGVYIQSNHVDVFAKTGFMYEKKPYQSIGIVYNFKYQDITAKFGNRNFNGLEKRGYINAIFNGIIGTTDHKIKLGANIVYADIQQHLDSIKQDRIEIVPGAFAEYTYMNNRLSNVVGARVDYHNLFGWQFSPRIHSKYSLTERTDLRFTIGKGWRVPNFAIDNLSLLASSKSWIIEQILKPEISWNIGGSIVQEMKLFYRKSSIVIDFYSTYFVNQLIVDRDQNVNAIVFRNLKGKSIANSFQVEWSVEPIKNFDIRFAYKYLDVKSTYGGIIQQQVMIPKHRFLFTTNYKTRNKRWEMSFTTSVYGQIRLAESFLPDGTITSNNESKIFPMLNAQITHIFKRWDFYLGGENLTNFKQKNPIIDAANPFGSNFDATRVWGPIMGINVYAGVRYSIKQKKS
jgi:outer membrane receptor protein involved in Fe transport